MSIIIRNCLVTMPDNSQNQTPYRGSGPLHNLVRGVAMGVGLARETYHLHEEKKMAAAAEENGVLDPAATHSQDTSQEFPVKGGYIQEGHYVSKDEATWQLDDAQSEIAPPVNNTVVTEQDVSDMADDFVRRHNPPRYAMHERPRLQLPVILPQRRPGERARGFIRAYAPELQEVGIDQSTFMEFITQLNLAMFPSPWLNAINLATIAAMHVPAPVTIAVSYAGWLATTAALRAHSRSKTNPFIDKINADFFRPHGLIAVILAWKPSQPGEIVSQVHFDGAIQQATQNAMATESTGTFRHRMQASHATTNFEWPESAPLVFPDLDKGPSTANVETASETGSKKPNKFYSGMKFVQEYLDNRGQAAWNTDNSNSHLAHLAPQAEFHSRYSDPNNPASSGSLVALVTGGAVGGRGPTFLDKYGPIRNLWRVMKKAMAEVCLLLFSYIPLGNRRLAFSITNCTRMFYIF